MHPSYASKWRFTEEDAPYVAAFESWATKHGWSRQRVERAFEWYATRPPNADAEALTTSFREYAESAGFRPEEMDVAFDWFDHTERRQEQGLGPELPPAPSPQQDAARKREIEEVLRTDRAKYYANEDLQREMHDILERQAGGPSAPIAPPPAPADRDARRAEIQHVMRTDRSRYWRDQDLQNEYRDLCADADTPSQPADAQPAPSAGPSPTAGAEESI